MENKSTKKNTVIKALFWKFLEKGGSQLIKFVIQIILARLLMPEEFGMIAIVLVFINIASVFVSSGLGTALVQKKEVDELDFTSIFYVSLSISITLYVILFFTSPLIARFYKMPLLENVIKILSLILVFSSFNSIQNAYLQRNMQFGKQFIVTLIASLLSGVLGIYLAYKGHGVWALVIQQLVSAIVSTIILFFVTKWRPKLIFSFKKVKELYSFGWKLLVSTLLNVITKDVRTLVIGFAYTSEDLAFYDRGNTIPNIIIQNVDGAIQSVLLPTLSAYQDDKIELKAKMRRGIKTSSYVIIPMMVGLAIVAKPTVILLLTDKWLMAVPFVQIFALSSALYPIHTANLQAINAMGRSDVFLKLEIVKVLVSMVVLVATMFFGVHAMAWGTLVSGILSSFINAFPNKSLLGYSYKDQIKDIAPAFGISAIMAAAIYPFEFLISNNWLLLITQVLLGIVVYIFLSWLFKLESFKYIAATVKDYFIRWTLKKNSTKN